MRNILSPRSREVLAQYASSNVLVAFDYDGTLAPIVEQPERAVMRRGTRRLLDEVVQRYRTVVISGRGQADARRRLDGVPVHGVVGNHGLEPWYTTEQLVGVVRKWIPILTQSLAPHSGVHIEDKTYSVAVHYRHSREKKQVRKVISEAVGRLGKVRVIGGKQVVNILPEGAPHKGIALERERERLRCDTALYVGDDQTDEDVFMLDQPGRLLTVRVGAKRSSAAHYYIPGQSMIDALLAALIECRPVIAKRRSS